MAGVFLDEIFLSLDQSLENTNYMKSSTDVLKNITQLLRGDKRYSLNDSHWEILTKVTRTGTNVLNRKNFDVAEIEFLTEILRCLRNSCAGSSSNQTLITRTGDIYSFIDTAFWTFLSRNDEEVIVLRCCLQLFGNLVCQGNKPTKMTVWETFLKDNAFELLLNNTDLKVQEYTMMILYNCISDDCSNHILKSTKGFEVLVAVTDSLSQNIVDWGILFLESALNNEDFMDTCYCKLHVKNRLLLLDVIAEQLDTVRDDMISCVSRDTIQHIEKDFIEFALDIVKICSSDSVDLKVIEVVKLLSILCSASVLEQHSYDLKKNKDLVEVLINTLKSVHLLGKQSCNAFSSISSLHATKDISKEDIESNPSYGFKKNLIRLIGNLCYSCKENQDLVRDLDGIPLLLDCCNLDARNPFVMQWCILAIRNILEKNMENQEVLANISVSGDLVGSSLLRELGFSVQQKDGKFVLLPAKDPS